MKAFSSHLSPAVCGFPQPALPISAALFAHLTALLREQLSISAILSHGNEIMVPRVPIVRCTGTYAMHDCTENKGLYFPRVRVTHSTPTWTDFRAFLQVLLSSLSSPKLTVISGYNGKYVLSL